MSKVVPIGCVTRLDLPADQVLENAMGKMESVVLLGYDKDGQQYFASTIADGGTVMWLLESCKRDLLQVVV